MTTADRQPPHHNTLTCYVNYRCRLPECVDRKRRWARERDRAIASGNWQPYVDAAPVRQHLARLLAAGLPQERIAALAGTGHETIADLTNRTRGRRGLRHRTSPELAARILAIDPASATPACVDPTGTQRRIQALAAIGWPYLHIAAQLNMGPQAPEQLLRRTKIRIESRQTIADGYELLRDRKPERHGVGKGQAKRTRDRAAARRWAPPKYWDEHPGAIDDRDFEPLYGVTRAEQIAQDAHWLIAIGGLNRTGAAERLGVSKSYVEHALINHPQELAA